jgi:hypothetical protein
MASRRFAAALVAAAAGLAGCGGDSDGDQLSAREYRERGNRICREAERDAQRLERAGLREQLEQSADAAERSQERFEQLEPPDELRDLHEEAERRGREGVELLREAQREFEGDRNAGSLLRVIGELERVVREGNEITRELGLTDCQTETP